MSTNSHPTNGRQTAARGRWARRAVVLATSLALGCIALAATAIASSSGDPLQVDALGIVQPGSGFNEPNAVASRGDNGTPRSN